MARKIGSKNDLRRLISIRHKDGRFVRIPRGQAHDLVDNGEAAFVSNTVYRQATRKETKSEVVGKQQKKAAERREDRKKKKEKKHGN